MIFAVALLLFGPRKLPEIGRTVGKALGEFRRASNDLQRSLEEEVAAEELRQAKHEVTSAVGSLQHGLRGYLEEAEPAPEAAVPTQAEAQTAAPGDKPTADKQSS